MRFSASSDPTKRTGRHFTPPELAAYVANRVRELFPSAADGPVTVLDPACGDGELLVALARALPADVRARVRFTGCDVDRSALDVAHERLREAGVAEPQLACCDFLDAVVEGARPTLWRRAREGFDPTAIVADVVIANPPYVRTQTLGAERAQEIATTFGLSGRLDLYHAFVVAMTRVMRPGGVLAAITSNRFLTVEGCGEFRRFVAASYRVREVVDLGDTKLFKAAVLPAVLVAVRRETSEEEAKPQRIEFVRVYESAVGAAVSRPEDEAPGLFRLIHSRRSGDFAVDGRSLRIDAGAVDLPSDPSNPWAITSAEETDWLRIVDAHASARFDALGTIRVGIKTTADNVFVRNDWDDLPAAVRPERELLRPLLVASDADRWRAKPGAGTVTRVLYTHEIREGRRFAIGLDAFPRARAYLEQHREQLEGRSYVREAGRRWYEIWVPQDPDEWRRPKIVFPDISPEPRFFIDRTGAIVQGACYWLTLNDDVDAEWLPLLVGLANSSALRRYHDLTFQNRLYAGRRRFMTQNVQRYPVPHMSAEQRSRIVGAVEELARDVGARSRGAAEAEIDATVAEAFGVVEVMPAHGSGSHVTRSR